MAGYAFAALLIQVFLRPDPLTIARRAQEIAATGRPATAARQLGAILRDVRVQIAIATLSISQFVMISTTSTSPVYLHDHGHHVGTIGLAVSAQTTAMMVIWFFLCLAGVIPSVANMAHAAGLGLGLVWGFLDSLRGRRITSS